MDWITGICLLLVCIFLYPYLDFSLGRYIHRKRETRRRYPLRKGQLQLITNGADLYKNYFDDLRKSTSTIHILFYIVKDDRFSAAFFDVLKEQAQKGVQVRLLLDWFGSRNVPKKWISEARDLGIKIEFCHRPHFPFYFFTLQQRNHRKITIIDGKIGYLGGYNIGKEYIDLDPKLSPWRDYHIRITGESVADIQQEFLIDWKRATHADVNADPISFSDQPENMEHYLFPSEGIDVEEKLVQLMEKAQKTVIIGTPYFVPPKRLFTAIEAALTRGVSVSVLVPEKSDHPIVKEASFRYLKRVLAGGGTVYQFQHGFFHAKVIVIDGLICDIGTANFDRRSILLNHEINCFIYDRAFIADVEEALAEDIRHSTKLTLEGLKKVRGFARVKAWIGKLVEGLL
ncbi:cardiolipin synthase [Bacillus sp. FSL K6-3431]|uniref:cardiolipin synthase n=1 Tax=Bacillus sp. FSL K6-3431 TaxID=2921500 RepID=UPI0030F70204